MSTTDDIQRLIAQADDCINREDFDALMSFYADDATLVLRPGQNVQGKAQLRAAFPRIAEFFRHTLHVTEGEVVVVEGADTALVLARTHVSHRDEAGVVTTDTRAATYVFRRFPDGKWLCAVDNSYGTALLGTNLT